MGYREALERELHAYEAQGNTNRADQVRKELRRIGALKPDTERVVASAPEQATTPRPTAKTAKRTRKEV